jgi:hypothetical protein
MGAGCETDNWLLLLLLLLWTSRSDASASGGPVCTRDLMKMPLFLSAEGCLVRGLQHQNSTLLGNDTRQRLQWATPRYRTRVGLDPGTSRGPRISSAAEMGNARGYVSGFYSVPPDTLGCYFDFGWNHSLPNPHQFITQY